MPRIVNVVALTFNYFDGPAGRTVDENLETLLAAIDNVAPLAPDLMCVPETFEAVGVDYEHVGVVAQTDTGTIASAVADLVREYDLVLYHACIERATRAVLHARRDAAVDRPK